MPNPKTKQQTKAAAKASTARNERDIIISTDGQILRAKSIYQRAEDDHWLTTMAGFEVRAKDETAEVLALADRKQHKADVNLRYSTRLLQGTTRRLSRSAHRTLVQALRSANEISDPEKRLNAINEAYAKAGAKAQ